MCKKLIFMILLVSMLVVSAPAQVKVVVFSDDFETPHDYVADNVADTGWDGYFGWLPGETVDALNASTDRTGELYIASTGGFWHEPWDPLGPFLYKYVEGDFIATVRVTDYSGTPTAIVYHNDGGLMARASKADPDDEAGNGEDWVSLDYFPIWNCGNFIWTADEDVRREQCNNGKRWNLDPYLQIEREGNTFHFRTSVDGVTWEEISCSPLTRDDFDGLPLQVGLRHATYSDTQGYVAFDDFVIEKIVQLIAYNPVPADGDPDVTEALLQWQAGETATWHDVYFGTDPDNLEFIVRNSLEQTSYNYDQDLIPGTTYYWRIDEVEADEVTIHQGNVWSFQAIPLTAWNPGPSDGAQCVLTDADLSWGAGSTADRHEVYFGTDESAVANATTSSPEFKGSQPETIFEPGELANDTTYYWRIDEIESDGTTKHPGQVWSFTTLIDIPVSNPALVGWWKLDGLCDRTLVVDSSGYNRHGKLGGDPQWIMGYDGGALKFDGRDDYVDLPIGSVIGSLTNSTFMMWADYPQAGGPTPQMLYFGTDDPNVYMSITPRVYYHGSLQFSITTGGVNMEYQAAAPAMLERGWHHVAVTINAGTNMILLYLDGLEVAQVTQANINPSDLGETTNNWLARSNNDEYAYYLGSLDDFRIYNYVLSPAEIAKAMKGDPMLAWNPSPANGSTPDVERVSPLTWSLGDNAAQHDVYIGTNADVVEQADASDTTGIYRGRQDPNSYTPSEDLEWGQTYYWRIDEYNNDGTISKGRVWSFTVADYIIVEDFELYNDIEEGQAGSNLVYLTWIDGYDNPSVNGSTMGYVIAFQSTMEFEIVHGGYQSAPFSYNNSTASYSEITVSTNDLAVGRDWAKGDVQVLTLWFYGDPNNAVTEQLYVKLNDVKVNYDGDAANLAVEEWTQWNIDLSTFSINLANVSELTIGLERIGNSSGSGMLLIDDIRLYRAAP